MSVPAHLKEATDRLEKASLRIDAAQEKALDIDNIREWLAALTDYVYALTDLHAYTNESVHEKLQALSRHVEPAFYAQ